MSNEVTLLGVFNKIEALLVYLIHCKSLGQTSKNNFVRFLVQTRTRKFASEIYWPLDDTEICEKFEIESNFQCHTTYNILSAADKPCPQL